MRKLNTEDVFKAFRLVTKSSLKAELQKIIEDVAVHGTKSVEKLGITGMLTAVETLTEEQCEHLFYELLSGPYEMNPEEVGKLDIDEQISKLQELYEVSNLKSFFTVLSNLLKKKS